MPVTERDELGAILTEQSLQMVGVDGGQRLPVGVEDAHGSVAGDDADVTLGHLGEVIRRCGDEIPLGMFGEPGGSDDVDPGDDGERIAAAQDVHVGGHLRGEGLRVVDRCRVQGIVIAGQQHDRDRERVEDFEGAGDDGSIELVRFEHVSADEDELRVRLGGERTDAGHGVEAGTVESRARLFAEVVRGHAQLPVPRGDESHLLLLVSFPSYGRGFTLSAATDISARLHGRGCQDAVLTWQL